MISLDLFTRAPRAPIQGHKIQVKPFLSVCFAGCDHTLFRFTFLCAYSCLISLFGSTPALCQYVQRQVRFRDLCQAGEESVLSLVCHPVRCKLPASIPFCGLQYPEFSSDGVLRLGNLVPDFSAGRSLQS